MEILIILLSSFHDLSIRVPPKALNALKYYFEKRKPLGSHDRTKNRFKEQITMGRDNVAYLWRKFVLPLLLRCNSREKKEEGLVNIERIEKGDWYIAFLS